MRKFIFLAAGLSAILSAGILPNSIIRTSSLSVENGGTKVAIDAYSDGAGALVINQAADTKFDNSPMNKLVFKYGDKAKTNNVRIDDQVITLDAGTSSAQDKEHANKINAMKVALEGITCDDINAQTTGDRYIGGVCTGYLPITLSTYGQTTLTIPANIQNITIMMWGAGGGGPSGGAGSYVSGVIDTSVKKSIITIVGQGGSYACAGACSGANAGAAFGGGASAFEGNGGGGGSFIRDSSNVIIAAAGGGGGQGGGSGGGGGAGDNSSPSGSGGNSSTTNGVATWNGGGYGGGGGGGYLGGGSGYRAASWVHTGGAGGTSYISGFSASGMLSKGSAQTPGNSGDANRGTAGNPMQSGKIIIRYN